MRLVPISFAAAAMATVVTFSAPPALAEKPVDSVQLGPRPFWLVSDMDDGELKEKLAACTGPFKVSAFSISHRGAPMQFPEHTREGYLAAARMGAGVIECDVTFTKDKELVCRHSQCDLQTTTDILAKPELAAKCTQPFTPAAGETPASAKCCTSDLTLAEFRQLKGKMDASNPKATTVAEFMGGTAGWRTDLYATRGTLLTHREAATLFKELGVKQTPELKAADVAMPFGGDFTQAAYAQKLIDELKEVGVDPKDAYPQSFNGDDLLYWVKNAPEYGAQGVWLDDRDAEKTFDANNPETWKPSMPELAAEGVKIIAPPMWMLVKAENGAIVPSAYAKAAKEAGLKIITWTLERSGTLTDGGGYYYQSTKDVTDNPGDTYKMLDVLAKDVGVIGVFSDWPATTSFYANCMGL